MPHDQFCGIGRGSDGARVLKESDPRLAAYALMAEADWRFAVAGGRSGRGDAGESDLARDVRLRERGA